MCLVEKLLSLLGVEGELLRTKILIVPTLAMSMAREMNQIQGPDRIKLLDLSTKKDKA